MVESINMEKRKKALKASNAVSRVEGASSSKQAEQIFRQWAGGGQADQRTDEGKNFSPAPEEFEMSKYGINL